MLCHEPDGHWVQAGIISFTSSCAQEDTPVLLTDMAAHSSWLQARAWGAAFLAQNPETLQISDEDSCVGMSRGCYECACGDTQACMTSEHQVEATVKFISAWNKGLIQDIHKLPYAN